MDDIPNKLQLQINCKGNIESIYSDSLKETLDAEVIKVIRASRIAWEQIDGRSGWSVRSEANPNLALRVTDWCRWAPRETGTVVLFQNHKEAEAAERECFWHLFKGDIDS